MTVAQKVSEKADSMVDQTAGERADLMVLLEMMRVATTVALAKTMAEMMVVLKVE